MDTFDNIRAFLHAARLGSFSAAARHVGTVPSVITKRIDQLEHRLGQNLFHRSTRRLDLTEDGAKLLPRCSRLLADFDDMLGACHVASGFSGRVQIKIAGPAAVQLLAPIFCDFVAGHPDLELDCRQADQLVNPLEDGCDIAIGMRPVSFSGVAEIPLAPYPRVTCASPRYLALHGTPRHPKELALHDCIVSSSTGSNWRFWGGAGEVAVDVRPRVVSNSSVIQREAALHDLGIATLPASTVEEDLADGRLVELFARFTPLQVWLKALVPEGKSALPVIEAILSQAADSLQKSVARLGGRKTVDHPSTGSQQFLNDLGAS